MMRKGKKVEINTKSFRNIILLFFIIACKNSVVQVEEIKKGNRYFYEYSPNTQFQEFLSDEHQVQFFDSLIDNEHTYGFIIDSTFKDILTCDCSFETTKVILIRNKNNHKASICFICYDQSSKPCCHYHFYKLKDKHKIEKGEVGSMPQYNEDTIVAKFLRDNNSNY